MGYSVYIEGLTPQQTARLEKVFSDEVMESTPFDIGICFAHEGLGYADEEHKDVFGFNYGDHDSAHTFVKWAAKKLGRDFYWYDGNEKCPITVPWWQKPESERSDIERVYYTAKMAYLEDYYAQIDAFLAVLDERWVDTPCEHTYRPDTVLGGQYCPHRLAHFRTG